MVDDSSDVTDQMTDPLNVAFVVCVRVISVLEPKKRHQDLWLSPSNVVPSNHDVLARLSLPIPRTHAASYQNKPISLNQCNSVNIGPIDTILAPLESSSHISRSEERRVGKECVP